MLDKIQSFFDRTLGAPAVAAELRSRSESYAQYHHECSRFLAPAWTENEEQRDIAKTLKDWTNRLSTQVIAEEYSAREHFEQLANILSIRESVRTQRRMERFTIAALLVAIGSFAIAILPLKEWLPIARSFLLPVSGV